MTQKNRPKLRMAPPPSILADQQSAAARLLALDKWTEEPNNPPATGLAATIAAEVVASPPPAPIPAPAPPVVVRPPAPVRVMKPWEGAAAAGAHPYHMVMTEALFQKVDFVWKRGGFKSMKEWMMHTVETEANKSLKGMGEL